jgi:hypothetical protein
MTVCITAETKRQSSREDAMRIRRFAAAAVVAMTLAGASMPAQSGYTVSPAGPADPRNNYVPQAGAVFVVDDDKGQISMCFPDSVNNKAVVICTPATKLP